MNPTRALQGWRQLAFLISVPLVTLILGCGPSAQLVNMWRDTSHSEPLQRLLVIVMIEDQELRRTLEDAFVSSFGEGGTEVRPSYRDFPDASPKPETLRAPSAEEAGGGIGGVLVITRAGRSETELYVPGYTEKERVTVKDSKPWGVYEEHYKEVHYEGYTVTSVVARMKGDLMLGPDGHLIWTATSEVVDPSSREAFREAVASAFAGELIDAGLVQGSN